MLQKQIQTQIQRQPSETPAKSEYQKKIALRKYDHHNIALIMLLKPMSEEDAIKNLLIKGKRNGVITFSIQNAQVILEHCKYKKSLCQCCITITKKGIISTMKIRNNTKLNFLGIKQIIDKNLQSHQQLSAKYKTSQYEYQCATILNYIYSLFEPDINIKTVVKLFITQCISPYEVNNIYTNMMISFSKCSLIITIYCIWHVILTRESGSLFLSLVLSPHNILLKKIKCYDDYGIINDDIITIFNKYNTPEDLRFLNELRLPRFFKKPSHANSDRMQIMKNILHNVTNISNYCSVKNNIVMLASCLKMFKNNITKVLKEQNPALTAYLCCLKTFDFPKSTYWYTNKNRVFIKAAGIPFTLTFCNSTVCSCGIEVKYLSGVIHSYNYEEESSATSGGGMSEISRIYIKNRHCFNAIKQNPEEFISYNYKTNFIKPINPNPVEVQEILGIDIPAVIPSNVSIIAPEEPYILFEIPDLTEAKSVYSSLDTLLFNSKLRDIIKF